LLATAPLLTLGHTDTQYEHYWIPEKEEITVPAQVLSDLRKRAVTYEAKAPPAQVRPAPPPTVSTRT
jgi:hypothetical protein